MRKLHISELTGRADGPVLVDAVPGYVIERGGVTRYLVGAEEARQVHHGPELLCILQGTGVVEVGGVHLPFESGDVFMIEQGEDHHVTSAGRLPLVSMWLHLRPA